MLNPLVSIITLNYNNAEATYRFLESTQNLQYNNYEVIVIDMHSLISKPDECKIISYKNTKYIQHTSNDGFSGGNNIGIKMASGEYIFLVNNDTVLTKNVLNILIETFHTDENIALVSPRINQLKNQTKIEYAGFNSMNMFTGRTNSIGYDETDKGQYNKINETAAVHGAAMMIKADKLNLLGPLPEIYFLYYEEWEYSFRAKRKNLKVFYNGNAIIYHEGSASAKEISGTQTYFLNRNRILFIRRNATTLQKIIFFVFYAFITFPKSILYYIIKEPKALKSYVSSVLWNLKYRSTND